MTYDQWKTRSPDDELFRGLPYGDEPPEVWEDCPECGGDGSISETIHVYEAGCGFSHPDVYSKPCRACNGAGGMICEAEGDQ